MNTKLRKLVKLTAAGLFIIALAINVKVTLDDPFSMISEVAIASGSNSSSSSEPPCAEADGPIQDSSHGFKADAGTDCNDTSGEFCGKAYGCEEDTTKPELPINQFVVCVPTKCAN